jgi:Cu+-exporting ATPase
VPVDGAIVAGSTAIDESMVTGESFPVQKSPGDTVLGGTINTNGSIEFRAVAVGAQTMVARIGALIEQAQGSKAKIQARADIIASVFVPIVLGVSLLTFVYWFAIGGAPLASALMNAIAVLVIACPCALGLATPTAIIVGTSAAASLGVLIKNAESLERLQRVDTIIFDKTGTLSLGTPAIATVTPLNGFAEERMVQLAVALESRSEHPAGSAFREYAKRQGIDGGEVEQFTSLPGKGLSGIVSGEPVIVGSRGYMEENSIDCSAATAMSASGDTGILVYIAVSGKLAGIVALADSIKPSAYEAVAALRAKGYRIILLSGDRDEAVRGLAKELGIDQVAGRMFPADKEAYVKRLEAEGHPVAFVGDGVNDGPALASASAGIAIGTGTDVAKEAADILLIGGDLNGIVRLIVLSRRIIGVIRQNLFWAFVYNMIGIPLAALGLLNPMFAASAMALSSVSVVSNSLRLKNVDKIRKARDFSHF